MDEKSMFSMNTLMTIQHEQQTHNEFHQFYYKLLTQFCQQYPTLSKIFFLQLVLRENVIIYTQNRVDARDVWLTISKKLQIKKPDIYVIDNQTNIQQILSTKSQYQRVMLYDVHELSNNALNKLLNTVDNSVSFMAIQNPHQKLSPHIADLFAISFVYSQQQQIYQIPNQQNKSQSQQIFDKVKFNEWVKFNFQITVQQSEEEGFLKPYLALLQQKIAKSGLQISHFRWKKMIKIMKFLGNTRQQNTFKKLSLSEISFIPQLLAYSVQSYSILYKINNEALKELIPYYGIQKFVKSIKNHFWLRENMKMNLMQISQQLSKSISFFYPCSKYPEVASIECSEEHINYTIRGYDKKLMSDHHYEIDTTKKYKLGLQVRSKNKMIVHIGIACYDKHKNLIQPIQICRKKQSDVVFDHIDGNQLYITNQGNLKQWNDPSSSFAFQKCIGIYPDGQTDAIIPLDYIIQNQAQPHSKSKEKSPYSDIIDSCIHLSKQAQLWFVNFKHLLKKDKTVLMNHYEGGTYCIGRTITNEENISEWKDVQIEFKGTQFDNTGHSFFPESCFIRVVLMANYSSGYPDYQIDDKNGQFNFRKVRWSQE